MTTGSDRTSGNSANLPPAVIATEFHSATGADTPAVRELAFGVLTEFGFSPDPAGTDADLDDLQRSYLAHGGRFELVVDSQGRLLGCAGLYPVEGNTVELRKMYLRPEARGPAGDSWPT